MKISIDLTLETYPQNVGDMSQSQTSQCGNEALLNFINSRPRPKAVIFASCFAFSLSSLMLYNFETALTIMDWKHIFSNTQALLVENKMQTNTQLIHKEESENIKIHCQAWGEYPLREIKREIPKGFKRINKIRMHLLLPQHDMNADFFRLSLLSPSEQDTLFACFSPFGATLVALLVSFA